MLTPRLLSANDVLLGVLNSPERRLLPAAGDLAQRCGGSSPELLHQLVCRSLNIGIVCLGVGGISDSLSGRIKPVGYIRSIARRTACQCWSSSPAAHRRMEGDRNQMQSKRLTVFRTCQPQSGGVLTAKRATVRDLEPERPGSRAQPYPLFNKAKG
jgi:hypothetical protein